MVDKDRAVKSAYAFYNKESLTYYVMSLSLVSVIGSGYTEVEAWYDFHQELNKYEAKYADNRPHN